MKTKIFTSLVILTLVLTTSCDGGAGSKEIILNSNQSVRLAFEETSQIKAESVSGIEYTSDDEFHATVSSSGLITGGRVGQTDILLSTSGDTKTINVEVVPEHYLYEEPLTDWGQTRAEIIAKKGVPDSQTENAIGYPHSSGAAILEIYAFDDQDRLTSSCVMLDILRSTNLGDFLLERYVPVSVDMDKYEALFINSMASETTTVAVHMSRYNTSLIQLLYVDAQSLLNNSAPELVKMSCAKIVNDFAKTL